MENKIGQLMLIDLPKIISECKDKWNNVTLSNVNNSVIRLGVIEGEFHWHKHDNEDEFFFVIEGQLFIDLEDKTVELSDHQGYTVPMNTIHRTRASKRTSILMVEKDTVSAQGD